MSPWGCRPDSRSTNLWPEKNQYFKAPLTKPVNIATYLAAAMLTYYFRDPEDALKRAKADSKHPGCYFGGITLPSGKRGFAVYEGSQIVERYAVKAKGRE